MPFHHVPVMTQEILHYLKPEQGRIFTDCTLGGGGHARAILETLPPEGILIGIDWDREAIDHAQQVLKPYKNRMHLFHGNFTQLPDYLQQLKVPAVDGILLDLGVSLQQLEYAGKGFSFNKDEPLDMRMDDRTRIRAEDLVNDLSEKELADLFKSFGEERWAKRIAKKVVRVRVRHRIRSSLELSEIVSAVVPLRTPAARRIHPATRVFMALRIAVNRELENLKAFLDRAVDVLNPLGRLCIVSFHSLEDRMVKTRFRELENPCTCPPDFPWCTCHRKPVLQVLTKRPVRPSDAEIRKNPMARSARLRAAVRIGTDVSPVYREGITDDAHA